MPPVRSRGGGGTIGMPDFRSLGSKLAAALVVGSVVQKLLGSIHLFLMPGEVLSLPVPKVWQLITYGFVAQDPLSVIFGAIVMVSIGGALESAWGTRRLLWFALGVTAISGAVTCLIFLPLDPTARFPGAWVMGSAMWVAFGLHVGRGQTNFWGMPVTGHQLAAIGAGFVVLNALMSSVLQMVPQLVACGLALAYMRGASPRVLWLRVQTWRLQRQVKTRSRHLKVISPERNTPRDSDRYLH